MSRLPYSNSKADPIRAQGRIRQMLQKFGVDRVGFDEDFTSFEVSVKFLYKNYPVKLPVNYSALSERLLKEDPWTRRKNKNRTDWEQDKRETAYRAGFSILEDFLKASLTLIDSGLFTFEEVFIGHFVSSRGQRLGEMMAPRLQDFVSGRLALSEGKD